MDGRGGCCIARYAPGGGGGGGGPYDMSKVDRIMLRFRPIAPKPACGGSSSGGSSPEGKDTRVRRGRGRRRQARGGNDAAAAKRSSRKRRACSKEKAGDASPPRQKVTLPLLPEMPERRVGGDLGNVKAGLVQAADYYRSAADPGLCGDKAEREMRDVPKWLSFDDNAPNPASGGHFGATIAAAAPLLQPWGRPSPCVTVECVTDMLVDGKALGCTDDERRRMDGGGFAWRLDVEAALWLGR